MTLSFQKDGDPAAGPAQVAFGDRQPSVTVYFRLDRPAEEPLEIGYTLDGRATRDDYTLEVGPGTPPASESRPDRPSPP